ncbi:hypothetical protein ACLOJK_033483 [Asimina triloba]
MAINHGFEDRLSRLEQVVGMILQQTTSYRHYKRFGQSEREAADQAEGWDCQLDGHSQQLWDVQEGMQFITVGIESWREEQSSPAAPPEFRTTEAAGAQGRSDGSNHQFGHGKIDFSILYFRNRSSWTDTALVNHRSGMGRNKGGSLNDRLARLKQDFSEGFLNMSDENPALIPRSLKTLLQGCPSTPTRCSMKGHSETTGAKDGWMLPIQDKGGRIACQGWLQLPQHQGDQMQLLLISSVLLLRFDDGQKV